MEEEEEGRWFGFSYHFDLTFYIILIIKIKNDHYGVEPAARRRRSRRRRADILIKPHQSPEESKKIAKKGPQRNSQKSAQIPSKP